MQFWGPLDQIPALYLFLDLVIYYVIYLFLLLIFNSIRGASAAMIVATAFFGIMNYELTVFRSMSFIASDIYSFFTALSVANTYQPEIDVDTAEFFLLALVLLALLFKLKKFRLFRCTAGASAGRTRSDGMSDSLHLLAHPEVSAAETKGDRDAARQKSSGSKAESADSAKDARKQADGSKAGKKSSSGKKGQKPNIIAIMNESFSDLAAVGDMEITNDYMPFFRSLKKNTIKGYTYSSVFGGNTANSEFEFLTGNTMAFLPDNSVPYQLFLRSKTAGLTYNLDAQGYGPLYALHPYYKTGYSRYKIYPLMGFDRFYTSDDFSDGTDTVNYHITDKADYKKIIELYEDAQGEDSPFYLFNVTMQNHGSYDGSTLETGDSVQLEGALAGYSKAEQYLNMVRMSDKALKKLIRYFEKVDEPTVIVFFGDHQPDLEDSFYDTLLGTKTENLEGEELEQLYKVPFLIWANYDIEEQTIERTSNNYLNTYLADVAGLEKTGYQEFLTDLREEVPCINAYGYWGSDGNFYEIDDETSPYYNLIHQYNLLEYNNLFGKEEQQTSFFYLQGE